MGLVGALLGATAAQAKDAPICTDRPAKANAVCTVPVGKWQLETAAVDWLYLKQGNSKTDNLLLGGSLAKFGLADSSDLQVAFTPFVRVSTDDSHISGFGDVRCASSSGSPARIRGAGRGDPVREIATAKRGIGNRKTEGGWRCPISFALPAR